MSTPRSHRAADLVSFCRERLAAFKVLRYIELRHEPFPRTPSQRIPKNKLKVDGAHQTSTAWDREAVATS
jgi:carnitine-CoA ligase